MRNVSTSAVCAPAGLVLDSDSVGLFSPWPQPPIVWSFTFAGWRLMRAFAPRRNQRDQGCRRRNRAHAARRTIMKPRLISASSRRHGGQHLQTRLCSAVKPGVTARKRLERQTRHMLQSLQRRPACRSELEGKRYQATVEAKIERDYDSMHVLTIGDCGLVQTAAKNLHLS